MTKIEINFCPKHIVGYSELFVMIGEYIPSDEMIYDEIIIVKEIMKETHLM